MPATLARAFLGLGANHDLEENFGGADLLGGIFDLADTRFKPAALAHWCLPHSQDLLAADGSVVSPMDGKPTLKGCY